MCVCVCVCVYITHTYTHTYIIIIYAKSVTETRHAIMSADGIISDQIHCHHQHAGILWTIPNLHHYQWFWFSGSASHIHLPPQPFIFINRHLSIDQMMVMTNASNPVFKNKVNKVKENQKETHKSNSPASQTHTAVLSAQSKWRSHTVEESWESLGTSNTPDCSAGGTLG